MKILTTLLLTAVFAAIGVIGFSYSGVYDVSASASHSSLIHWFLSTISHASIERRAQTIQVPDLTNSEMVKAGINDFDAMCVGCHGAPGKKPEAMGMGLNPKAPDLAVSVQYMSAAELFWVTKHGIRMTGMPSWGTTHDDEALWPVVAFMMTLPEQDEQSYQSLLDDPKGRGHHAEGEAGSDHDAEVEEPAQKEEVPHDDGHDHSH